MSRLQQSRFYVVRDADEGDSGKSSEAIHSKYDLYKGFFRDARDGLARLTEQFEGEVEETDRGASVSGDLARALL
jgi:hypothetical protein